MNNFLIDEFPTAIDVSGEIIEINSDFRVGLAIMADFEDEELDDEMRFILTLKRLYKQEPADLEEALAQAIKYLNGGDESPPNTEKKPRTYSFVKDAKLIYSAFNQTHGIDLQNTEMHWWKFMALFMDLGAETAFNTLVNMRSRHYDGKTTEEEEEYLAKGDWLFTQYDEEPMSEEELIFRSMLPDGEGIIGYGS